MALTAAQITTAYQNVLQRTPSTAEVNAWVNVSNSGALTDAQIIASIVNSPEAVNYTSATIRIYQAAFGRVPDKAGLDVNTDVLSAGAPVNALAGAFVMSQEFANKYNGGVLVQDNAAAVTDAFLQSLYVNVLGRTGSAAEIQAWKNAVTTAGSGYTKASDVLVGFSQSAEFVQKTGAAITTFLTAAANGTAVYTGPLLGEGGLNPGQNLVLSVNVDNVTGTSGSDTITADNTQGAGKFQLTAADTVNGGAGIDTLKVFSDGTAQGIAGITTAAISNIENIFVNNLNGQNLNVSGIAGVTGVQIDAPGATGSTITVKNQAVTFSNESTGGYTFTVASDAADTAQTIGLSKVGKAGGADTIDLSGTKVATATINATGGASVVTLTNTGTALTTLKVTGDQGLTLTESLNGLKTIDASAATGAVKVDASGATVAATFAFTGGSGNDGLTLKAGAVGLITAGTQLDGGAGKDTLTVNDTTYAAADYAKLSAVKNFEVLALGTTGATIDAAQIVNFKEFTISTGTETINNIQAGTTINITGATTAVNLGGAVGVNAATINLGSATAAGFTTTALTTTGLTNLTINEAGTSAHTITTLNNADNSNITLTGSADLTITNALSGTTTGSKVDASAMTGKFSVVGSGKADIIIGGSAADTLTSGGGGDTLTGNGGTDKFVVSAAGDVGGSSVITTITDIASKESVTLKAGNGTEVFSSTKVDVSAATLLTQAFDIAAAGAGDTNSQVKWFQFGGNTYIVEDNSAAGTLQAGDQVVKLVGTVDLTLATWNAGTDTLTLA